MKNWGVSLKTSFKNVPFLFLFDGHVSEVSRDGLNVQLSGLTLACERCRRVPWWIRHDPTLGALEHELFFPESPLVMTNIAMGFRWPIEIDGLPIKVLWFYMAMLNNQMVCLE